jgi:hypothetical protein
LLLSSPLFRPTASKMHPSLTSPCYAIKMNLRLMDGVSKLLSGVHGEGSSSLTKSNSLWTISSSVAGFAEQLLLVLRAAGRVQQLVTHGCNRLMLTVLLTDYVNLCVMFKILQFFCVNLFLKKRLVKDWIKHEHDKKWWWSWSHLRKIGGYLQAPYPWTHVWTKFTILEEVFQQLIREMQYKHIMEVD